MLRQAHGGHLKDLPGIHNLNAYVVDWCASWHLGDIKHCLSRLEAVYVALHPEAPKAVTPSAPAPAPVARVLPDFDPNLPKRQPKVYEIPETAEPKTCECGAEIFFVTTPSKATMPVTADGVSHFETCPDARKFSGRNKSTSVAPPEPKKHEAPKAAGKFPSKANPTKPRKPGSSGKKKAAPPANAASGQQRLMF